MNNRYASFDEYGLRHLPGHLLRRENWQELEKLLTDFDFLEIKCSGGMVHDLLQACVLAVESKDLHSVSQMLKALSLELSGLFSRPEFAIQSVYNRLVWFEDLDSTLRQQLDVAHFKLNRKPFWVCAKACLPTSASSSVLFIPFEINTSIQSLAPDGSAIATASVDGEVNIYSLATGTMLERRNVSMKSITAVALCESPRRLAWRQTNGQIHSDRGSAILVGCSEEEQLLYHPQGSILAIQEDNALVAWQAERDDVTILIENISNPLVVLRFSPDGNHVICVAGYLKPMISIVAWDGSQWSVKSVTYAGPPVIDADFDPESKIIIILRKDRSVQVIDMQNGRTVAHLFYEKQSGGTITGAPSHCACGVGPLSGQIFFGTRKGHIANWCWQTDDLEKYENCYMETESLSLVKLAVLPNRGRAFYSTERAGCFASPTQPLNSTTKHKSEVSGCFITASGKVVSAGKQDKTLRWFSADGLHPVWTPRIHREITIIAPCFDTDDVLIGDQRGWIWVQPPDRDVTPQEIEHSFETSVKSAFLVDRQTAIAADQTGRILRIQIIDEQADVLRRSQGWEKLQKLLPAGKYGLFWSLRHETVQGDQYSVLSLHQSEGREEEIFRSRDTASDFAVSTDGGTVCLTGAVVRVFCKGPKGWVVKGQRDAKEANIKHIAFVGYDDPLIATALTTPLWLEIWETHGDLRTVAAAPLQSEVTCLSTFGRQIIAGCQSGDLISLYLNINKKN